MIDSLESGDRRDARTGHSEGLQYGMSHPIRGYSTTHRPEALYSANNIWQYTAHSLGTVEHIPRILLVPLFPFASLFGLASGGSYWLSLLAGYIPPPNATILNRVQRLGLDAGRGPSRSPGMRLFRTCAIPPLHWMN